MLALSKEEADALSVVILGVVVQKETYGAPHWLNWKKTALSWAKFYKELVCAEVMPTPKAKAAFLHLQKHHRKYQMALHKQVDALKPAGTTKISSIQLFIQFGWLGSAIWPVLYPKDSFTDF